VTNIGEILNANLGRYLDKHWDWDAFPSNRGYAELERAQMRYIGAGGSPKVGDPGTLAPGAFTCSLIYQEVGKRASVHFHQIEELFFIHAGTLTMTWQFENELVDFTLGPGDAVLNPLNRPHGFRNDGPGDVVMQIMVATAGPMSPTYTDHPAKAAENQPLRPASPENRPSHLAEIERSVARGANVRPQSATVEGGTIRMAPYVMPAARGGLVEPTHFSYAVGTLTRGASTPLHRRDVEEAFMVLDGVLDVEFDDAGERARKRLGPRDLVLVPAGVRRRLLNEDAGTVRFGSIVGARDVSPFGWTETALSGSVG
jgi:mannose-6-phosphate isomerase-like protein (cupin superfamily)